MVDRCPRWTRTASPPHFRTFLGEAWVTHNCRCGPVLAPNLQRRWTGIPDKPEQQPPPPPPNLTGRGVSHSQLLDVVLCLPQVLGKHSIQVSQLSQNNGGKDEPLSLQPGTHLLRLLNILWARTATHKHVIFTRADWYYTALDTKWIWYAAKDASWPKNVGNVQIFASTCFIWWFYRSLNAHNAPPPPGISQGICRYRTLDTTTFTSPIPFPL